MFGIDSPTRARSLLLTTLMITSAFAMIIAAPVSADSGRTTGTEEIQVSVTNDYYDRTTTSTTSEITVTILSSNLDINTEYTLDWQLCNYAWNNCNLYEEISASQMNDPAESEGTIDLGSGNMLTSTTITFTDPGIMEIDYNTQPETITGIDNESYYFEAVLNIQGVYIAENTSNPFVLGGEMIEASSYMSTNENILKNTGVTVNGVFTLDYQNENILEYEIVCGLFEDGITTPVDTYTFTNNEIQDYYNNLNFDIYGGNNDLVPTAVSGTHHVECTLTRNVDSFVMGTIIGNDFDVIDAETTGTEEFDFQVLSSTHFDRTMDLTTTQITVDVDFSDLYIGQAYSVDWQLCNYAWNNCNLYEEISASQMNDPAESEGQFSITSTTGTHTESFTFTDPGIMEIDYNTQPETITGIDNESYYFEAVLNIQGVYIAENTSNPFVLGGEMIEASSYMSTNENILKNTGVTVNGVFTLDYQNENILEYEIVCGLFEDGITTPVDTYTFTNNEIQDYYNNLNFDIYGGNNDLVPTAVSGTHHVECTLTRNVDSFVMGTIIGNDFDVIDAETTGTEEFDFQVLSSTHFDRTMDLTTTQITVDVDFSDLYIGQAYSVDWQLCNYAWNNCNLYEEISASQMNDPAESEGQFSITSTTGTHTESFTFTDPGIMEIDYNTQPETITGIDNESYYFEAVLNIQGVYIAENTSNPFVLGGEMIEASSYMSTNENILKNTGVTVNGVFTLDYQNENILEYEIVCGLFEDGITTPVDTYTFTNNEIQDYYNNLNFDIYGGNNDLVPTAVSGTHHVECTLTRNVDSFVMGTIIGNDFDVIDDTGNQDDATITVSHAVDSVEGWATVTIEAIDLDAGQSYSLVWEVDDNTMNPVVDMDDGSYEWVEGTDGVDTHVIEFRALGDSTDACFSVTFFAGVDTLQTESAICWNQLSTSDMDGDGVYDKDDQCANTPASVTLPPGSNGCADSDNDGWDDSDEIACNTLPGDAGSTPIDIPDVDGICNYLDEDDDDDGFLDIVEDINQDGIVDPGETDPLDANSFPANRLPTCGLHYTLEADGMPATVTGEAVIPALSPAAAAAANAAPPPQVTLPAGSYYIIASCIDLDGDPITVQVNSITVGPLVGEVNAGAIIEIGPDVAETLDVTITWSDGIDSATATITVNLDGSAAAPSNSGTILPGFTTGLGIMAMLSAVFVFGRSNELVKTKSEKSDD